MYIFLSGRILQSILTENNILSYIFTKFLNAKGKEIIKKGTRMILECEWPVAVKTWQRACHLPALMPS